MKGELENIVGYPVSIRNVETCTSLIEDWIGGSDRQKYFVCANPHSLVTADKNPAFKTAILEADLVTPDGSGIVLASRILGGSIQDRVTGSDVFTHLSDRLDKRGGCSYFFLGASPETLKDIEVKMAHDYPGIRIAGTWSPPFKAEFSEEDNRQMIEAINQAKPDVLWIGMTAPKQEKWIHQHRDQLDVKFIGAIGAVFDFYTGRVKRSHPVFQKMGLEWLPRLVQEPRRLFKRNFVSSPLFLLRVFQQKLGVSAKPGL